MILKAFSIRDSKSETFNIPFFKRAHGEAERDFSAVVRDPKTSPGQFPEDYDLYYVGHYDDNTGVFEPLDTPQHMLKGTAVQSA